MTHHYSEAFGPGSSNAEQFAEMENRLRQTLSQLPEQQSVEISTIWIICLTGALSWRSFTIEAVFWTESSCVSISSARLKIHQPVDSRTYQTHREKTEVRRQI
jgi:hypothetical protein